jgi:predicted ribosome quality control (RQC) complex YloA/Tae2 family protein
MKHRSRILEFNNKQYTLLIGRNRHENIQILKESSPHDIWFHLEDISGPHLVLKTEGQEFSKQFLYKCATILREYKKNLPSHVPAIYTEVKYVKQTHNIGEVNVRKTTTIMI